MSKNQKNLIWIDLEMTGLDTMKDEIIEIATIVTDKDLNVLQEGPVIAIKTDKNIIDSMDEWNTRQHTKSGLVERVLKSSYSYEDAEKLTIEFLEIYSDENQSPMCGSGICQDRRFLSRCMPSLEKFFHYRNLDVSSVKEIASRWYPDIKYKKEPSHVALQDVKDSIDELKFYRDQVFVKIS